MLENDPVEPKEDSPRDDTSLDTKKIYVGTYEVKWNCLGNFCRFMRIFVTKLKYCVGKSASKMQENGVELIKL